VGDNDISPCKVVVWWVGKSGKKGKQEMDSWVEKDEKGKVLPKKF